MESLAYWADIRRAQGGEDKKVVSFFAPSVHTKKLSAKDRQGINGVM
jgi:hypothetical protein